MKICLFLICLIALAAFSTVSAAAQSRDFLTEAEIELVRDAQQIDGRVAVLIHAADRRFGVLKVGVGSSAKPESKEWGAVPEGTRMQLLVDIKRILQKAIDDIDNLSERPDSMVVIIDDEKSKKKPPSFADLFPKAVRSLSAAADRYKPALKSLLDQTKDEIEKGPIFDSLEMCDQITAAVTKLPADAPKPDAKKH